MRQLIFILILVDFVLGAIIFSALNQKSLVAFLNVGEGESVLIKNKKNIFLYDTGKYPSLVLKELDKFTPFYNKKIDILFLSHPDNDHYFASFEILKRYKVRMIAVNTLKINDSGFQELLFLAQKLKIPILVLKRGSQIADNHFKFLVLHPDKIYQKDNDSSLVIKVIGKNSYLLTGDIEKEGIESLIDCCRNFLNSNIFLVSHHGSKYSINEKFYSLIKPSISVISVGQNFYGHPHKETLDILKKFSQTIWRTDLNKTLIIKE